jgi:hypothetical protein
MITALLTHRLPRPLRRITCVTAVAILAGALGTAAQVQLTRQDAETLQRKILTINDNAQRTATAARTTTITERELNSYLRYQAAGEIPVGVMEPYVWILGDGRVRGRAIVDLDAVRTHKRRGWLDPAGYLTGRMPLEATGVLRTRDGIGRFELETAELGGVTVPKAVLQEIVSYYSRTPEQPAGVTLDDPFELPAGIRDVKVAKGQAIVVQ